MEKIRLQKLLSQCGYGSRRDCEKLIACGRVRINGEVANLGQKGDHKTDIIEVDGLRIKNVINKKIYIALNKPRKVLSDIKKTDKRKTILDLIETKNYLFIVGRLDYMSEGLILLTNDGDLANKLTHPRYEHEKEYLVLIRKIPTDRKLEVWRNGVTLRNGYKTLPATVKIQSSSKDNTWLTVVLKEGKKRQIREIGQILGLPVMKIIRVRIGPITLGDLKPGKWRYLKKQEIDLLKHSMII